MDILILGGETKTIPLLAADAFDGVLA